MNDAMRRAAAILLLVLGGVALWWAGSGAPASASANDAMVATIAAARERVAANDPRLKGASRFEEGGWIYVHLEGEPGGAARVLVTSNRPSVANLLGVTRSSTE